MEQSSDEACEESNSTPEVDTTVSQNVLSAVVEQTIQPSSSEPHCSNLLTELGNHQIITNRTSNPRGEECYRFNSLYYLGINVLSVCYYLLLCNSSVLWFMYVQLDAGPFRTRLIYG